MNRRGFLIGSTAAVAGAGLVGAAEAAEVTLPQPPSEAVLKLSSQLGVIPEKTIPRSPGHREEWVQACIAGRPQDAKAGFWYSAPFTEALLVGVLPIRLGKRIAWDAAAMKAKNAPEADALIHKPYRAGFELP
ncbi:twin-arginine translocation signal domain-containing protein [Planctomycetota bacterium]